MARCSARPQPRRRGRAGCVRAARAAGFDNVSIDLMFGVPEQSFDDWRRDVDAAIGARAGARVGVRADRRARDGVRRRGARRPAGAARRRSGGRDVRARGRRVRGRRARALRHSSYAAPDAGRATTGSTGRSARTWASGRRRRRSGRSRTAPAGGSRTRARPTSTCAGRRPATSSAAPPPISENEAVWLGLRTAGGIDRAAHRARYGVDPVVGRELESSAALASGWLVVDEARVRLTPAGELFADEVAARLWK